MLVGMFANALTGFFFGFCVRHLLLRMRAVQLKSGYTSHRPRLVFDARIPQATGDTDQLLVRKISELNENERLDVIAGISR